MSTAPTASDRASLLRRFGAIIYDCLLLIAILIIAALPLVYLFQDRQLGPQLWYRAYLGGIILIFFTGFWSHGGQTLGMRAWRVKLVCSDGRPVDLRTAVMRFFAALVSWSAVGLGFLWQLIDKEKLTWHDRLSRSQLVVSHRTRSGDP